MINSKLKSREGKGRREGGGKGGSNGCAFSLAGRSWLTSRTIIKKLIIFPCAICSTKYLSTSNVVVCLRKMISYKWTAKKRDTLNKKREPVSVLFFKVITERTGVKNADIHRANEIFLLNLLRSVSSARKARRNKIRYCVLHRLSFAVFSSFFFRLLGASLQTQLISSFK